MRYDLVIRNLDPELMKDFRRWCMDNGIPIAGRKSLIGPTICEIIRQHITKDSEDTKTRLETLKDILDRNIIPKKVYYAPQKYIEAIVARTMIISSPNLIRNYAALCGYEYDRRRRMYKVPERATPASQARLNEPELDPEAEKVLKIAMDHAEKVRKERADSVRSTSSDQEDRPGSSPGPRTTPPKEIKFYPGLPIDHSLNVQAREERKKAKEERKSTAGRKRGKPRAANRPMPSCPVCNLPVHARQSSVEDKPRGKIYHKECYEDRARTVKV